jgi:hypothetical protein
MNSILDPGQFERQSVHSSVNLDWLLT